MAEKGADNDLQPDDVEIETAILANESACSHDSRVT